MEKTDHDRLIEIHGALLGINGQKGLLREVKDLKDDYYSFKKAVLAVFFFLLGTGVLGVSFWKLAGIIY